MARPVFLLQRYRVAGPLLRQLPGAGLLTQLAVLFAVAVVNGQLGYASWVCLAKRFA
jgi:hypothetical protein